RDPLNEYKREAFEMFEGLLDRLREAITGVLSHIEIRAQVPEQAVPPPPPQRRMQESRVDPAMAGAEPMGGGLGAGPRGGGLAPGRRLNGGGPAAMTDEELEAELAAGRPVPAAPIRRTAAAQAVPNDPSTWGKVARNAPCPCGSGKK